MTLTYSSHGRITEVFEDGKLRCRGLMLQPKGWEIQRWTGDDFEPVVVLEKAGTLDSIVTEALAASKGLKTPKKRRVPAVVAKRVEGVEVIEEGVAYRTSGPPALIGQPHDQVVKLKLATGVTLYGCTHQDCDYTARTVVGVTMHYRKHNREDARDEILTVAAEEAPAETFTVEEPAVVEVVEAEAAPVVEEPTEEPLAAPWVPLTEKFEGMPLNQILALAEVGLEDQGWKDRALRAEAKLQQVHEWVMTLVKD